MLNRTGPRYAAWFVGQTVGLVVVDGQRSSLLSEVDSISGVSGGTFPASYFALFGDRIFDDFEARFLKKNVEGAMLLRESRPFQRLVAEMQ